MQTLGSVLLKEPPSGGSLHSPKRHGLRQAAINYAHRKGYLTSVPIVTLPEKTEPKDPWLTRSEAARLLWVAHRGYKAGHLARLILIGLYTGTRKDVICRMGFSPNTHSGWFDLERGIMFRNSENERTTKKRRTPAPVPRQLLAHLRRWRAAGAIWAIEYNGAPMSDVKRAFIKATLEAGLNDVTPNTLKHTAITLAVQNGVTTWEAAGFFATSQETIEKVYGHHAPSYMETARRDMESPRK